MSGLMVSVDGLRRNLSSDIKELRDIVEAVVAGDHYDEEDLRGAMNNVICDSNVLNCVYVDNNKDFNDISHIEVDVLD